MYVVLLVKASLKLLGEGVPPQVRHYGFEMMQVIPCHMLIISVFSHTRSSVQRQLVEEDIIYNEICMWQLCGGLQK